VVPFDASPVLSVPKPAMSPLLLMPAPVGFMTLSTVTSSNSLRRMSNV
jgi:hypothetical protein